MTIKKLSENIINQIAAGEVIERPASAVKEVVENAIDAGATKIEIFTSNGGKGLIAIKDNGIGMSDSELQLAILRHCTSKIQDDIQNITHLGFRGEALPSIGSVAKLKIISRSKNSPCGFEINLDSGKISKLKPCNADFGTLVEIRDLFYFTPARLKFLKTDRAENAAISEIVKRLALARPEIHFHLNGSDRQELQYLPCADDPMQRYCQIIDENFSSHSVEINCEINQIKLHGFIGKSSISRGNNSGQYIYINKRYVHDKLIMGAIRAAYFDILPKDRYGICVLFLSLPANLVDVNVHPAKSDVRFFNPNLVKSFLINSIKNKLLSQLPQLANISNIAAIQAFNSYQDIASHNPEIRNTLEPIGNLKNTRKNECIAAIEESQIDFAIQPSVKNFSYQQPQDQQRQKNYPLGAACAQIHKNYILSQTEDSLIIIDQHAAHERIVYEKLKKNLYSKDVKSQFLLMPQIIALDETQLNLLLEQKDFLNKLGLIFEILNKNSVIIHAIPALLYQANIEHLVKDLADKLQENESQNILEDKLNYIAATIACHNSIRAGRQLPIEQMNDLLRKIEQTANGGNCNHGRPTYIELKLQDIEKLFERR